MRIQSIDLNVCRNTQMGIRLKETFNLTYLGLFPLGRSPSGKGMGIKMKIAVAGTGYVGLVAGVCFAEKGYNVTCVDVDQKKVEIMRQGISPIYEEGLEALMQKNNAEGRLHYTTDYREAYRDADAGWKCNFKLHCYRIQTDCRNHREGLPCGSEIHSTCWNQ